MSKSDAQRRSYLADQMTMGERVEAVTQKLDSVDNRLGELEGRVHHEIGEDVQYFHDELRSLGRRVADLESSGTTRKATNPGMTHFVGDNCPGGHQPSPTECGRIVVDANEWDRLKRLEKRVLELKDIEPYAVSFVNAEAWNTWVEVTRELK